MKYLKKFWGNFIFSIETINKVSKRYLFIRVTFLFFELLISYLSLFLWKNIINHLTVYSENNNTEMVAAILITVIMYVTLIFIHEIFGVFKKLFTYKFNDAIQFYLDAVMIKKTANCDLSFFDSPSLKRTMRLSRIYILNLQKMSEIVFDFINHVSSMIIAIMLLSSLNWMVVLVILFTSFPSIIVEFKNRKLDLEFDSNNTIHDQKMEYYCDLFFNESARQDIIINHSENYIMQLYNEEWKIWNDEKEKSEVKKFLNRNIGNVVLFLGECVVYCVAIFMLIQRDLAVGDVSYYISLLTSFRSAYTGLFMLFVNYDDVSSKVDMIRKFLGTKAVIEKSGTLIPSKNPIIEFRNVSFSYPNSTNLVLRNCSFVINPGEVVGLVGLNGSGKSTIVKLLCRFYDPIDGEILIDGINAKEYDIVKLRALFAVLFQDYVKYSFSMRENIALSDISRVECDEQILEAAKKSLASSFIECWEKGIDENMTRQFDPNGKDLSGGQWQRVSLARAFFRDSPIILLDEPSSALDPVAENKIFEDITNLTNDKSALLISHRLSSITFADKIIFLENGQIIEKGSHTELINIGGKYAQLFSTQANKYIL